MKKRLRKRIFAGIMTVILTLSMNAMVFAASDADVNPDTPGDRQYIGSLLTSCGDSINYSGSLTCNLGAGNSNADICAGVSPTNYSGTVSCYVTFPNGSTHYLGSVSASGGNTGYYEFSYCSAGTYTFDFYSSIPNTLYVYGRIYD